MKDDAEQSSASAATLHTALLDYYSAPGRYQLTLRQPATLFASIREVLQIAAGRGSHPAAGETGNLREAAAFFIRAALLYPGADHYAVMGYAAGGETRDLKERYRLLMRLIHPDFSASAAGAWPPDAAVRVNRAYEVLSSPTLLREYLEHLAALRQRPVASKPTSHMSAALPSRKQDGPRLLFRKRAAWAVGISLAAAAVLMLLPRPEPQPLVQRRPAASPTARAAPASMVQPAQQDGTIAQVELPRVPPTVLPAALEQPPVALRTPPPVVVPTPLQAAPQLARPSATQPAREVAALPGPMPARSPVFAASRDAPVAAPQQDPEPAPSVRISPGSTASAPPERPATRPVPASPHAPTPLAANPMATPAPPAKATATGSAFSPTMGDAQPLLTHLLHVLETGSGEQLLRLLDKDARRSPAAVALSRNYEMMIKGARPVRLSDVEFKGEPREDVLLVTGRVRVHAGETTIGAQGQRFLLRAEFASRGGKVMLLNLSDATD